MVVWNTNIMTQNAAALPDYGLAASPLIVDEKIEPAEYVAGFVRRFAEDVAARIRKFA